MPEIGTSGSMSGDGKRSNWQSLKPPRPSSTLRRSIRATIPSGYPRPSKETTMEQKMREIRADHVNPRFNWGRALPALGTMGVDFEERVDYRRLHRYRISR